MKRFIICEDDRDMVDLLNVYLTSRKYDFLILEEGGQVLPEIKKDDVSFLLLDLNLPDMDGRDVIRQIRNDPETSKVPIIVFTATAWADDIMNKIPIEGVLKKPFDLSELKEVIHRYSG